MGWQDHRLGHLFITFITEKREKNSTWNYETSKLEITRETIENNMNTKSMVEFVLLQKVYDMK